MPTTWLIEHGLQFRFIDVLVVTDLIVIRFDADVRREEQYIVD